MSRRHYRAPRLINAYGDLQRQCTEYKNDALHFEQEYLKMFRRALDAEQRNVLLVDINKLQRERIAQLEQELARAVRVDNLTPSDLKLAS